MKQLIEHIKKSIYGPEYYRELSTRPISFSLKYYAGFVMLLALFLTIIYSIPLVPLVSKTLRELPQTFVAYYPDELEVVVVNGIATTTVPQPFFLPVPAAFKEELYREFGVEYLGVIDLKSPVALKTYREHRALFWIAENALVMRGERDEMRVSAFDPDLTYTFNEEQLLAVIASLQPYFKFVVPVLVFFIFAGLCIAFAINAVYLLFPALLLYIAMLMIKPKWAYGTAFQVCLHAATLPLMVSTFFSLFGLNLGNVPFATTIFVLLMVFINMRTNEPVVPKAAEAAGTAAMPPAGE